MDQDPAAWERLFAFFVSDEMERAGVTPAAAAVRAKQRLVAAWGLQFSEDFPLDVGEPTLSSTPDLPGKTRTDDGRFWFILARVEDERSLFPESERIKHDMLSRMTAAYDPEFRKAALIGPNGGPSHDTGEFSRFIPGHVEALEFDGYYLWGLVSENFEGYISWLVEDGHEQRSIQWWPALPELTDAPPYLRHVAMLTGEPPGTPNLPSLDQWFLEQQGVAQDDARGLLELTSLQRSLDDLPRERSFNMSQPANQDGTPPAGGEVLDLDELTRTITASVRADLAADAATQPDANAALTEAVASAIAPLQEQLAGMETAAAETATTQRNTRVTERLDQVVRDGRLTPQERGDWERVMTSGAMDDEAVEAQLASLATRSKIALFGEREFVAVGENEVRIPSHLRTLPNRVPIDPASLKLVMKARAAAADEPDPDRAYQIKRKAIFEACGEELTN